MNNVLLRFVQISDTHLAQSSEARLAKYNDPANIPPQFAELILKMRSAAPQMLSAQSASPTDAQVFQSARRMVEEINALPVDLDFVLHTGDVAFDPETDEEYEPIKALFSPLRFPIYFQPGNHDHSAFLQKHLSHLPESLPTFDYEIPNDHVQIVCMDSSIGWFTDAQLTWLEARVRAADERPLVVTLHHNVVSYQDFFGDGVILTNHSDVRAILASAKSRLRGVFYGHMHMSMDTIQDDIPYFCAPSGYMQFDVFPGSDNTRGVERTLPGYNLVTIMQDGTHVRRLHYSPSASA